MKKPAFVGGCVGLGLWLGFIALIGMTGDAAGIGMVVSVLVGGVCAKALQRSLLGAASGFWHSVPGRYLIGRMAGLAVILLLVYPVYHGLCLAAGYLFLLLYSVAGMTVVVALFKPVGFSIYVATAVLVWRLRTPVKVMIGKGSRPFRRWYRSFNMGCGGSAGFASILEEWANPWRPGLIFLGHSIHDRIWAVGVKDDRMMTVLAGTGGGKNLTCITPNMLGYPGSVYCNDVKGQNAAITAEARRAMGHDVYILDPFGKDTARFNPLVEIDPDDLDYFERVMEIAEAIVIPGEGKDRVWSDFAKIVIAGLIDLEIRYHEEEMEGE